MTRFERLTVLFKTVFVSQFLTDVCVKRNEKPEQVTPSTNIEMLAAATTLKTETNGNVTNEMIANCRLRK